MSYRTIPMYTAVCDECGYEYEDDEFSAWGDKDMLDETVEHVGWTATQGRHLCEECVNGVIADPIEAKHGEPGPNDSPLPLEADR